MIEEIFYDLEHGAEIEPGILVAINMHKPNALHVISSQPEGQLMEMGQRAPIGISGPPDCEPASMLDPEARKSEEILA